MISIIIPVYNAEEYLKECLESIYNQTDSEWEIIAVDDGSTDSSWKILQCEKDRLGSKIKIIHQENQGQVRAREAGIRIAKGRYCIFVDADDWLDKFAVEKIKSSISKYKCDILVFDGMRVKDNNKIPFWPQYSEKDVLFDECSKSKFLEMVITTKRFNNICFKAIRRGLLVTSQPIKDIEKVRVEEDLLMQLQIFDKAQNIVYTPQILYNYRFNNSSVTNCFVENRYIAAAIVNQSLVSYAKKWGFPDKISILNQRYFVEITESIRQLNRYKIYTISQKRDYILRISHDKYFINMWDNRTVNLELKRIVFLYLLRKKFWTLLLFLLKLNDL